MKGTKHFLIGFAVMMSTLFTFSQEIGIGEWRDHLPYSNSISLTEVENKIFCATPYSVFYYNKEDYSVQRLTKVNGLTDIGISTIKYNAENQTLVVAYTNTNIDLLKGSVIINISDIKRKPILGNKTINNITFRAQYAYLACGFGIVVLDIDKEEISDTYYIGPEGGQINVYDITFDDQDSIYAATEAGIYKASLLSPNLADFSSWTKDLQVPYPELSYNIIEFFAGRIFANNINEAFSSDTVFMYDGQSWSRFDAVGNSTKGNIQSMYGRLVFANNSNVDVYDASLTRVYFTYAPGDMSIRPQDALIDKDDFVWEADRFSGLVKTFNDGWSAEVIKLNGPKTADVFALSVTGKDLWAVPGGRDISWGNIWKHAEMYGFVNGSWTNLDYKNIPEFEPARDMVCVVVDPANSRKVFGGTWGYGIFEFINNELTTVYTDENSTLQPITGFEKINIGGLIFDNDHNLWVANSNAASVLSVMMNDGSWHALTLGSVATGIDVGEIVIDQMNQKWMLVRDHGLLVFNDNNTITNPNDDQAKKLNGNPGNGDLPGLKILSFAVDQDGELWLGSDEGVAVIYSPGNVFNDGNYDAQRILVEQDGYVQYLLETEAVTTIAVDGANRKWFGTDRAGVFLMSEDGTKQILHFNDENSPLLSNSISSIVINDDGEVFFGTSQGIISYKGTATPTPPPGSTIYAYPNPVREDYNGVIAIKGLFQNSDVKITDVSGTLVFATKAEGSQAIWHGRNFNGDKVQTGVYLVFITNDDGSETAVTKILVIN
jgi:streptogramin lyase